VTISFADILGSLLAIDSAVLGLETWRLALDRDEVEDGGRQEGRIC